MKYAIVFIAGALIALAVMLVLSAKSEPQMRDNAIFVHITNDTKHDFQHIKLETDTGQKFTCTLRFNSCSFALAPTGDVGFRLFAIQSSGITWSSPGSHPYYAEPGANFSTLVSELAKDDS